MSEKNFVLNIKTQAGTIITVRGDSAEELNVNILNFINLASISYVAQLETTATGAAAPAVPAVVAAAFPGAQVISNVPAPAPAPAPVAAPAAGGAPVCRHGQMAFVDGTKMGKTWKAWMCPQPKEATDKCQPQWIK